MIPGSQHTPIVALDLRTGRQRVATSDEACALADVIRYTADQRVPHGMCEPIVTTEPSEYGGTRPRAVVRRLSCEDPADQREIWRLAALAMGYTPDIAMTAILSLRPHPEDDHVIDWMLVVRCVDDEEYLWGAPDGVSSSEEATAALCTHVWGQA